MQGKTFLPGILLGLLAVGACESAFAPDDDRLSAEDAQLLASEFDVIAGSVLDGALGGFGPSFSAEAGDGAHVSAAPVPVQISFTRTHNCPKGGSVTVAGTITGERDRAAHSLTTETNSTKTQANCAVETHHGVTITTNGNPNIALKASHKKVNGALSGVQTQTQKGGFTFSTSDGRSGSCEIDITSTFDPATRTHTLKGTTCGRTVDRTRTRGA